MKYFNVHKSVSEILPLGNQKNMATNPTKVFSEEKKMA
jgi:hypothetical protein